MTEKLSCHNCEAACCKGNPLLLMNLSPDELGFMKEGGNKFIPVTEPAEHDRDKVIYPAGIQINPGGKSFNWVARVGNEYEPLPAGLGRYALLGDCKYLVTDENGWESCSVYDDRPQVCQDFEMGSPKCLQMREIQGVPLPMAE